MQTRRRIAGLRRTHGLTWEELARLVGITPSVLERLVNGSQVPDDIRIKFNNIAALLTRCDHGTAGANRRALFSLDDTVYALLCADKLVDAERRLEAGAAPRPPDTRTPLSSEALEARRAPHPVLLLGGDTEGSP